MKFKLILIFALSLFVCSLGFAGEIPKVVKTKSLILSGKITDIKSKELLAGVKITCADCKKTVYSDLDGNFFIYLETTDENLKLEISQVGYSSKTLNLQDLPSNPSNLQINLASE
ncbi:MAG: carboxypeptidase-like regulatory domain-containing protein [Burkholderiales bacterium]|nr:carboxypeptidase-like regulatory domain-containing protein [Bacteroidia bacterium]